MQSGLCVPVGAQAPVILSQRKVCCPKLSLGGRPAVFTTRVPAKASRSRSHRAAAVTVTASTASSNGNLLPWQAAMDEVKKRKDLKSIMIIGAGPIVIGQVGGGTVVTIATPVVYLLPCKPSYTLTETYSPRHALGLCWGGEACVIL